MRECGKIYKDYTYKIKPVTEWLYIAAMTLYLLYRSFKNTTFDLSFIGKTDRFFIVMFSIVLGAQIITHLDNIKGIIIAAIVMAASIAAYQHNAYIDVIIGGFLIAGCIDVQADRILKIWTVVVVTVIIIAAFTALCGIIENYTYISFREYGYRVRGSLGIIFPTDSATWILFGLAYIWAAWKKITDEAMILVTCIAMALFYYYQNGQTAVLCGAILVVFIILDMILEKKGKGKICDHIIFWLITVAIPAATAMLVVFAHLYGKGSGLARRLDGIIDLRISESYTGISSYGIKLLGTNFKMYGFGNGNVDNAYKYFYLDSSYINILVRFGIIVFVIYVLLWILTARKALKAGDRRLLLVALLITIQSAEEHHFAGVIYNPLFFMALARFTPVGGAVGEGNLQTKATTDKKGNSIVQPTIDRARKVATQMVTVIVATLVCLVFVPHLLSTGRTIYQKSQYKKEGVTPQMVVAADSKAVETILSAAKAPVYTDVLPNVYYKKFDGFKKDIFFGGDHARAETCTVLMDSECESTLFFTRGFLYSQISDYTGVYTNDEAVSEALTKAGYHVTGFYSSKRKAIVTDKKKISKLNLQGGKYTAYWKIHLKKEPEDDEQNSNAEVSDPGVMQDSSPVVCTLRATSDVANTPEEISAQLDAGEDGEASTTTELGSIQVLRSDFDEEGNAEINLVFVRGVESTVKLSLKNEEGYKAVIEECKYAQTPDVDAHNTINFYGQVIKCEYFDFDGNSAVVYPGCSIIEYEYNENKQISRIKFYDADGNKVMTEYGCWMIEYEYDEAGAVLAEKLFDMDGNPVPAQ